MSASTDIVLSRTSSWKRDVVSAARECGHLQRACEIAQVPYAVALSMQKIDKDFAEAISEAIGSPAGRLFEVMLRRALEGDDTPVIDSRKGILLDKDNNVVMVKKHDTRLQIEVAKALMPDKFREPKQLPAGSPGANGERPKLDELFAALDEAQAPIVATSVSEPNEKLPS